MNKTIAGILTGIFALIAGFCLVVLIWASVTGKTFLGVIKSWIPEEVPASPAQTQEYDRKSDPDSSALSGMIRTGPAGPSWDYVALGVDRIYSDANQTKVCGYEVNILSYYVAGETVVNLKSIEMRTSDGRSKLVNTSSGSVRFWLNDDAFYKFGLPTLPVSITFTAVYANGNTKTLIVTLRMYEGSLDPEYIAPPPPPPESLLPPDPVKEGYTFVGWYLDADLTQPYDGRVVTEDLALYAKFDINRYTVTYNVNGGTSVGSVTLNYGQVPDAVTTTREGYAFGGWYTNSALTSAYNNDPIRGNTTLYAKWTINTYTVTYNTNGGTSIGVETVEYGKLITAANPTKEGHAFAGWYCDADLTQAYAGEIVKTDLTLYAKWQINVYTVTFDVAGGSIVDSIRVDWDRPLTLPAAPIREGYNFLGWYLSDGTEYTDQAIRANTTLKADWAIKTYRVVFYVDGVVYQELTITHGTKLVEALSRSGMAYAFTLDETALTDSDVVTSDLDVSVRKVAISESVRQYCLKNWWSILILGVMIIGVGVTAAYLAKQRSRA